MTVFTDFKNNRLRELVEGCTVAELTAGIREIPGAHQVRWVVQDLDKNYRSFVALCFSNAQVVADRFHVQRLMTPMINKLRIGITGDKRKNPSRLLLLRNRCNLQPWVANTLDQWLKHHPELREAYWVKESIVKLYRTKGFKKANKAFYKLLDTMALSNSQDIQKVRAILLKWKTEILNFFHFRLTNGKTEGFNNLCKLVQRRAFGYKSFHNYRLMCLITAA